AVRIDRFAASDDFGNVVNPMIVEGQVHGGLAQGIGQALLEGCVYSSDGQLLTGSLADYALPRADDLPHFAVETAKGTPCTHNPLGVKGCGEAGAIGSPRSEEHTSELQSHLNLVCRLLLEKKNEERTRPT